jgi:Ca2+-binding RTX toxin-like protein
VSADGSHSRRLTNNPGWDWEPAWSPDGRSIIQSAFINNAYYDGSSDIFVMRTDGSRRRDLTPNTAVEDQGPDWQPVVECTVVLAGGKGRDRLRGPGPAARLLGLAGDDLLLGGAGGDCLMGASGSDSLRGRGGADFLAGGFGKDSIVAGRGADHIWAGPGTDLINARDGVRDHLDCGWGHDRAVVDHKDQLTRCEAAARTR